MKRFSLLLLFAPVLATAQVHYTLKVLPATHEAAVTITAENKADKVSFFMPAWVPGFYVLLDEHAKNVSDVKATDGAGKPLKIEPQTNFHEWVVDPPKNGRVIFSYKVKGNDPGLGFFGVNVRDNTAFVLGGAAFMYIEDRKTEPTTLTISNPGGWDTGTSMDVDPKGTYHARDYDELIDHPIDLGHFVKKTFTANGLPFEVDFVTLDKLYDDKLAKEVADRLQKLVIPAMQMFGKSPFKRYVFHLHFAVGNFSGGLEHQASVTIAIPPQIPAKFFDDLFTHEFFHAWNVKNIRPAVLGPFDYTREVRTDNLWFAEGVTDYYAKIDAYRSGLDGVNEYLFPALTGEILNYQRGQTRLSHSVAEASRGAWEGDSEGMGDLSYYNKGLLSGWFLDAEIRKVTNGQKSLDDVMRYMYEKYHLPDKAGYPEDGILKAINEVSGQDLSELYHKLIYQTDDLPYDSLEGIGIRVEIPDHAYNELGFTTDQYGTVKSLESGVESQGLEVGDKITAINGGAFGPVIVGLPESGYSVNVRRQGKPVDLQLMPVKKRADRYKATFDPFCTPEQGARLMQWLQRPGGIE